MKLQTLFIAAFLAFAGSLYAQERSFSYQGMLLDAAKQPVSGEHHITITLYDSPTGSEAIHSESFATPVVNGVFSVVVGSQTALSTSVKFDKQYWLGISVNGGAEMLPRTALTSVPYATHADAASSLTKGATGAVTSLNGATGDLEFQGGPGTFVKTEGKTITITSIPIGNQEPQADKVTSITGTANQILANGTTGTAQTNDVTLTLPQDIHSAATPSFAGMTLSAMPSGTSTDLLISDAGQLQTRTLASLNLATSADLASEVAARAAADANDWHVTGGNAADASSYVGTNNNTSLRLQVRGQAITNSVILNNNGSIQRFETGDARGIWAVDLQNDRYSTEQVASGDYSVIAGGRGNIASGFMSFVGGGGSDGIEYEEGWGSNRATGDWSSVVAGWDNRANGNQSFVGGGWSNYATGSESTIAGGGANEASGDYTVIAGGLDNTASGYSSTVGGGKYNFAIGYDFTTVSGGYHNTANGNGTSVGGGWDNTASGAGSSIGGGINNVASGEYFATVSGGGGNTASGHSSTVSGGNENIANGYGSSVGGGFSNEARGEYWATVSGGANNTASGHSSAVGGGDSNQAIDFFATVSGGKSNRAGGHSSSVGGGEHNTASGYYSTIGGGLVNEASGSRAVVSGGHENEAIGTLSTIPGGRGLTLSSSAVSSFGILANNTDGTRNMTIDAANTAVFGNANLWLANTDGTAHELRFYEAQSDIGTFPAAGTNYTAFKAQSQTANITYTLPSALPTAKGAMVTTSGGALSWGSYGRVAATATSTQTINDAAVTDSNTILVTLEGTMTTYAITGRSAGTSFTITTGAALTTSDMINYQILP